MRDPRIHPVHMLKVGELFAVNGDRHNALRAYQEVADSDEPFYVAEAVRRIDNLDRIEAAVPLRP